MCIRDRSHDKKDKFFSLRRDVQGVIAESAVLTEIKTKLKRLRIDTEGGGTRVIYSRFERRASGRSSRSLILRALLPSVMAGLAQPVRFGRRALALTGLVPVRLRWA